MQRLTEKLSVLDQISGKVYAVLAVLWAAIILVLTLTPGEYVPSTTLFSYDKLGHGGIFCIQAILLMYTFFRLGKNFNIKSAMWWGFFIAIGYGLIIEFVQNLIPGRGMEIFDALANSAGSFLALITFYLLNRKKFTKSM
jgi:VanZ family protein